jgi:hypothetical protein
MIRYKVKPGHAGANEELVREVYEELAQARPNGFRYATFKLADGASFVHLASHEVDHNPLQELGAFQRFQAELRDRCEEQPVLTELEVVGSYGFFGEAS